MIPCFAPAAMTARYTGRHESLGMCSSQPSSPTNDRRIARTWTREEAEFRFREVQRRMQKTKLSTLFLLKLTEMCWCRKRNRQENSKRKKKKKKKKERAGRMQKCGAQRQKCPVILLCELILCEQRVQMEWWGGKETHVYRRKEEKKRCFHS